MSAKWGKRPPLRDGERVTIVMLWVSLNQSHTLGVSHDQAIIRGRGRQRRALAVVSLVHLTAATEGITWCRGWAGKEVDALKTVAALSANPG